MPDFSSYFGWVDDPAARIATQDEAGIVGLSQAAPRLMLTPANTDVLLYKAWKDVLGEYPPYPAQQIGDCEGFGNSHGHDLLQCIEAATEGIEYFETCTEATYAAGREAGNMLRSGDGCYGAAIIKGITEIGLVRRKDVGDYSGVRARQWGRAGLPSDVRQLAGKVKLGGSALVTTVDEVDAALANGCPVPISSSCGFEGNGGFRRDTNGFCYVGGSWPHCMVIVGRILSDGTDSYVIAQSWGDKMPGGAQPFDLPDFCFRARRIDVARYILPGKDCYALSSTPGFARKPLPTHWSYGDFA